jgi:hypothetical protein
MLMLWVPMNLKKTATVAWLAWTTPLLAPLASTAWLAGLRQQGYLAQAALLTGYFILSVGMIVRWGLKKLHNAEVTDVNQAPDNAVIADVKG